MQGIETGVQAVQSNVNQIENSINGIQSQLNSHKQNNENPHNVTKAQIGLGNVKNQSITVTTTSVSDGTNTFSQFNPSSIN